MNDYDPWDIVYRHQTNDFEGAFDSEAFRVELENAIKSSGGQRLHLLADRVMNFWKFHAKQMETLYNEETDPVSRRSIAISSLMSKSILKNLFEQLAKFEGPKAKQIDDPHILFASLGLKAMFSFEMFFRYLHSIRTKRAVVRGIVANANKARRADKVQEMIELAAKEFWERRPGKRSKLSDTARAIWPEIKKQLEHQGGLPPKWIIANCQDDSKMIGRVRKRLEKIDVLDESHSSEI